MQVSAQADHSVNALTTQLTGQAMLQLRLIKGAYSAEHLHATCCTKLCRLCMFRLCDCMWVCFDPRERTICGLATVAGGRGAVHGGPSTRTSNGIVSVQYGIRYSGKSAVEKVKLYCRGL